MYDGILLQCRSHISNGYYLNNEKNKKFYYSIILA